jgi:hypothetical protein
MPPITVLSDAEIEALISCAKAVTDSSRKAMRTEGAHRRADIKLESADGKQFAISIRQSTEFMENFTIGLRYIPQDGSDSVILFRCNGPHGPSNGTLEGSHHPYPHIHTATEDNLREGARAEKGGVVTTAYSEIRGATDYFLNRIGFPQDQRSKCFPVSTMPLSLFPETNQ